MDTPWTLDGGEGGDLGNVVVQGEGADPKPGWSSRCVGAGSAGGGATSLGRDRTSASPVPSQCGAWHGPGGRCGCGADHRHKVRAAVQHASCWRGPSLPSVKKATPAKRSDRVPLRVLLERGRPVGSPGVRCRASALRPVMPSPETNPTWPHAGLGPRASCEPVTGMRPLLSRSLGGLPDTRV